MKILLITMLATTLGTAAPVAAQDSSNLSAAFKSCAARAGSNTVQVNMCAQREVAAQDDRLNKAYQRVMRQLANDPGAKTRLRDEERRWIAERDYSCKINGTTIDSGCVVLKTAARADVLESQVRF